MTELDSNVICGLGVSEGTERVPGHPQGEPVSAWLLLVAALPPAQHLPFPAVLLPHHTNHHRQHYGQVQRHASRGELAGQDRLLLYKKTALLPACGFICL